MSVLNSFHPFIG